MSDIDYFGLLKKSWQGFKNNLVLLLPVIINIVLMIGLGLIFLVQILIIFGIFSKSILQNPKIVFTSGYSLPLLVFFVLIDLLILIMINSYIRSMQIGMNRDVVKKNKTSVDNMFKYGKKYFQKYFIISIIKLILYLLPFLILGLISMFVFLNNKAAGIIVGIFSLIILLIYSLILGLLLFFLDPIIVSQEKSPWELVKNSFSYTKNNLGHVIITFLVILLVAVIVGIIVSLITMPISFYTHYIKIMELSQIGAFLTLAQVLVGIIRAIINIIIGIILDLFRFNSYFWSK